jgi:sulfite reductase alpha subunit
MHYTSKLLRDMCDMFVDNGGSGLIAFHGQSGDIMLQGATEETTQTISIEFIQSLAQPETLNFILYGN